jgi:hypothetical protein
MPLSPPALPANSCNSYMPVFSRQFPSCSLKPVKTTTSPCGWA